ncbi:hypothetical protein TNCV_1749281 [Trichonephila clavipes]|nr:hypothetical protein TNCV_1749281 [Trichonephila clavipes]
MWSASISFRKSQSVQKGAVQHKFDEDVSGDKSCPVCRRNLATALRLGYKEVESSNQMRKDKKEFRERKRKEKTSSKSSRKSDKTPEKCSKSSTSATAKS